MEMSIAFEFLKYEFPVTYAHNAFFLTFSLRWKNYIFKRLCMYNAEDIKLSTLLQITFSMHDLDNNLTVFEIPRKCRIWIFTSKMIFLLFFVNLAKIDASCKDILRSPIFYIFAFWLLQDFSATQRF